MQSKLINMKGNMTVVTHPPKLPNASQIEKEVLAKSKKKKLILNIDKKPIG